MQNSLADISSLVTRLRSEGISLWEDAGKLRYRAPQGMLAANDLETLKQHRERILAFLKSEKEMQVVKLRPETRYEPFPLTDVQAAYLLGRSDVFDYGGTACHIYFELNYPELEIQRVTEIWNQLIARHDMLRATMKEDGYQQVQEKTPWFEVEYQVISTLEARAAKEKLEALREEMGHRVYPANSWPMFDVKVTKTVQDTIFHFSIEFLIADWASIWQLISEFETLYYQPQKKLPEFELSFRDYLLAERKLRETDKYKQDREYWLNRIDTLPQAPDLSRTIAQATSEKVRFSRRFLQLAPAMWQQFKEKAQKHGLTPTIAVMTAYAATIEKWSHNKEFCLNLTVLNRLPLHSEVNDIIGDFTSVNLLAVDCTMGKPFADQAKSLNAQLFDDLDHRLFSGVEVIRELSRRRDREAALMPIVFTSAIGLLQATEQDEMKGKFTGEGISQTPQVFIDCQAMDGSHGLQVNWDVREGIFPENMVDDMFDSFEVLLNQLAQTDQAWNLNNVVSLPEWQIKERQAANTTQGEIPDCFLHSKIIEKARETPDKVAVIDGQGQFTYEEIMLRASAVAAELQKAGCKEQDRVAIIMDKSAYQVISVLGILSVGAVYVPIDVTQPLLRQLAILEKAEIVHVLACGSNLLSWPEHTKVIQVDTLNPLQENNIAEIGDPDKPAYIIHTSGSTGEPKGVVITHRAAVNTIKDINDRFQVSEEDKVLGLAQLSFDLSVYDIFGTLSQGGTLVYPAVDQQTDPGHLLELFNEHKITIWNSVPAMMQMLLVSVHESQAAKLASLRVALLSGDWIPLNLPDMMVKLLPNVQVVSLGGATEASIWSIYHLYKQLMPEWNSIPYGKPLTNQGWRVLDQNMNDCPVWVTGELYITGIGLAQGYFGDPISTAERFFEHPVDGEKLYRTGDMGRYVPGGEIEFLGRQDNQVKIRGYRVELGEIEAALLKYPAVTQAVVIVETIGDSKTLVGFVEANTVDTEVNIAEMIDFLAERLPNYMVPAQFHIIESLPLTSNGKIDRKALLNWNKGTDESPADAGERLTASPLVAQITKAWTESLGISAISPNKSFYDYGADSLIMAQVAGKLRDLFAQEPFKYDIPFDTLLRQMLNYSTLAALVEFVETKEKSLLNSKNGTSAVAQQAGSDSYGVFTSYGGGEEGPLRVVFHAGMGTMNCFRFLLKHLDTQQAGPVIGITIADTERYCALDDLEIAEQLADEYAERIIETGHTDVQLIGYCIGGLVALEVSRRLLERGINVVDLVLISSHPIIHDIKDDLLIEALFVPNIGVSLSDTSLCELSPAELGRGFLHIFETHTQGVPEDASVTISGNEILDKVGALFRKLAAIPRSDRFVAYAEAIARKHGNTMPAEMAEGMFKVFHKSLKSALFKPEPYMGDIRFLLAEEPFLFSGYDEDTLNFWQDICLGEFALQRINGNHITCIETEPNATYLAKLVLEGINKYNEESNKDVPGKDTLAVGFASGQ
ncbi:amino acid adenylation domain-containing protein [Sporomusa sphaeroides DSM 2875]|uniref:non-ribosomal peptide synthetase n=1 Tax=Sporomusa sphaeroides TaxID=47679 RepID=UPI00202F5619|nr:amino acid adenylation domain-containing protein [Sporomusa sphaeroides]MCM0760872.1 amino acid adenylation domain-containing protein [Sporomusa sphaeroides DSM 2875]